MKLTVQETIILLTVRDTLILLSDINPYTAHRDDIGQEETFQMFNKIPLQVATPTSLDGCVYDTLDIKDISNHIFNTIYTAKDEF